MSLFTSRHKHDVGERGSTSMEVAVLAVVIVAIAGLMLAAGRLLEARGAVHEAAAEAARAASISRNASIAADQVASSVKSTLDNSHITCSPAPAITADLAAFGLPLTQSGDVTVTVTCRVPLSGIVPIGLPGELSITQTGSSVIDAFRERG